MRSCAKGSNSELEAMIELMKKEHEKKVESIDSSSTELNVKIEADDTKKTISIARCYPMKNRSADVLPFDTNRVALPTTKVILS